MIGSILGDVVGSRYEFCNHKSKDFDLFHKVCTYTDDSVCTLAVAKTLIDNYPIDYSDKGLNKIKKDLVDNLVSFLKKDPDRGYGGHFFMWATSQKEHLPYNSWGNGSGMRVSPVGWIANTEEEVLKLAKATAEVTHNHIEGIKGAQAIAMCIFMARKGKSKKEIKEYIYEKIYPILDYLDYDELVKNYEFDVSCQGSVPHAIYSFLLSKDYEDAIRIAVSIGGDTDTIACMTGGIAEAFYNDNKTNKIIEKFLELNYLPNEYIEIIEKFNKIVK